MRVFVAGATGVIGSLIVPLLVERRFTVAGMTRSTDKGKELVAHGAVPVVCDVYDTRALNQAVVDFSPDAVIHELTTLPDDPSQIPAMAAANARIRRDGTRNLLTAASLAGAHRFLAQSVAWQLEGDGGAAVAEMETMVLGAAGTVLRYGHFYGPGTYHPQPPPPPRVHIATAASRTVDAIYHPTGIFTILDPL